MRSMWNACKHFFTAEEVPRWFGLSLILIYLVGLGSVAQFGIVQVRQENSVHFQRVCQHSVKILAESLLAPQESGEVDAKLSGVYQRELREFAANIPVRLLRVVDGDRRVVASTDVTEIGLIASDNAGVGVPGNLIEVSHVEADGGHAGDVFIRARLTDRAFPSSRPEWHSAGANAASMAQASPGQSPGTKERKFYLEAVLPCEPPGISSLAEQARTLAVVLVVLGALFVVYRCLREQLRGVSRIADRLQTHRDRLEEELGSLRITDTLDGTTRVWNDLIDLTQTLSDTAQKSKANEELSRVLQRSGGGALAEALNALPDGLVYITDEVRFEYLNSAACRFFGWSEEEAKETTLPEAESQGIGGQVLALVRQALQPDGSFGARSETITAGPEGGDQSAYRIWVLPLRRPQSAGECVLVIRDASQQIRAEHSREEFITQVTHELRTPLTNIRAYAETLSSGMFDDPKVITECYNVITKETRRLSRLVEDILSVSQLEVGTIKLETGSVDLETLLSEGMRDVRGIADEAEIDLQLALPSKMEPIEGDRDKLAVVINNLLGNAIKYTRAHGNVQIGCKFSDDEVIMTFKDNGIGIDQVDHTRVFEKFQRGSDPEVQDKTGTGIGLYTAREIVRRHHGDIELISEKGKGSTFLVRLPRRSSRAVSVKSVEE